MASIAPTLHTRSANYTESWITPKWLIDRLGPFDLDPCACDPQPWPTAARMVTERENGLLTLWSGFVWCNPPYGKQLGVWLERMALHQHGIACVFARTETRAFDRSVWNGASTSVLFLRKRLAFFRPDGTPAPQASNSGGPSCLIAYGQEAHRRLMASRDLGSLVTPVL